LRAACRTSRSEIGPERHEDVRADANDDVVVVAAQANPDQQVEHPAAAVRSVDAGALRFPGEAAVGPGDGPRKRRRRRRGVQGIEAEHVVV
jgi:hypothetical protein